MYTEGVSNTVYIGQPSVVYTFENVSGNLTSGGTGSLEVHMLNMETVHILEFTMEDMPNYFTISGNINKPHITIISQ